MPPVPDAGPSISTLAKRVTGEGQKKKSSKKDQHRQQARATGTPGQDRKKTFKAVFENPLQVEWPDVPLNVENAVLACAVQILEPVREYNEKKLSQYRQTKRQTKPLRKRKRQKKSNDKAEGLVAIEEDATDDILSEQPQPNVPGALSKRKRRISLSDGSDEDDGLDDSNRPSKRPKSTEEDHPTPEETIPIVEAMPEHREENPLDTSTALEVSIKLPSTLPRPETVEHLVMGLNEVTKRLENQVKRQSGNVEAFPTASSTVAHPALAQDRSPTTLTIPRPLRLVLVCRTDADAPAMIAHLPILVATCNSRKPEGSPDVVLVALPLGAENTLAEATGLRRALALGFDIDTPGLELLEQFLSSIPILTSPWLGLPPALPPTHIKHLATSTPKDPKIAKANRLEGRKEAKKDRTASKPTMKAARPLDKVIIKAGSGGMSRKGPVMHRPAIKTLPKVIIMAGGSRRTTTDEHSA